MHRAYIPVRVGRAASPRAREAGRMRSTKTDRSARDIDAEGAPAPQRNRVDWRAVVVLSAAFVLPGALGGVSSHLDDACAYAGPGGGGKGGGGGGGKGGGGGGGGAKSGKPPPPKGKPPPPQ